MCIGQLPTGFSAGDWKDDRVVNEKKIDHIKRGKPFSLLDIVAISLSLVLCLSLVFYSCASRTQGATLVVYQSHKSLTTEYDLTKNTTIELDCEGGLFAIVIQNGAAYVQRSPCRGQDCVHMSEIRYSGQKIICAEFRISLSIEGEGELIAVT